MNRRNFTMRIRRLCKLYKVIIGLSVCGAAFVLQQCFAAENIQNINSNDIVRLSREITANPKNSTNYLNRAIAYFSLGDFDRAMADCEKVLELDPTCEKALGIQGQLFSNKHQPAAAIKSFSSAILINPTKFYYYNGRGTAYLESGTYDKALEDFDQAIRLNPTNVSAFRCRGIIFYAKQDFDKAITDFQQSIRLGWTNDDYIYGELGYAYLARTNNEAAMDNFNIAIQRGVENDTLYYYRGIQFCIRKDFQNAVNDMNRSIKLNPTNAMVYASRGYVLGKLGRFEEGIADCTNAVALMPSYENGYNNLAWILSVSPDSKIRDGKKAVQCATKACELSDWKVSAYVGTLAAAYAECGNFEEAIKWQQKAIELGLTAKDLPQAQKALELYKQGKPYRESVP